MPSVGFVDFRLLIFAEMNFGACESVAAGYFVGRPVNSDAPEKEPVVEQAPVNDNIPGGK